MQVTNIANAYNPQSSRSFTSSRNPEGKVRYKHFEQLSDDVLSMRSIIKAHKDVEKSNKMRIFKAIPSITTALIGTSLAIAQPGKFSKKLSTGLGFLVLSKGIDFFANTIEKVASVKKDDKEKNKKDIVKKAFAVSLGTVATAGAVLGIVKGKDKIKKFVTSEAKQLSKEINSTKIAQKFEEKVAPFLSKHPKLTSSFGFIIPMGLIGASSLTQIKLADSLSDDLKTRAQENFKKGKEIQKIAREHFDSVDAIEV